MYQLPVAQLLDNRRCKLCSKLFPQGWAMKPENRQAFEVQSHFENLYNDALYRAERPPRSAKLVVNIDLGSNPGSGDVRIYLLSTNRERSSWILWVRLEDENGKPVYWRIATGRPYRGYPAKFAAEQLLTKIWQDQADKEGWRPPYTFVIAPGLLTGTDMRRITLTAFGGEV
jgi:hypothetical protein